MNDEIIDVYNIFFGVLELINWDILVFWFFSLSCNVNDCEWFCEKNSIVVIVKKGIFDNGFILFFNGYVFIVIIVIFVLWCELGGFFLFLVVFVML